MLTLPKNDKHTTEKKREIKERNIESESKPESLYCWKMILCANSYLSNIEYFGRRHYASLFQWSDCSAGTATATATAAATAHTWIPSDKIQHYHCRCTENTQHPKRVYTHTHIHIGTKKHIRVCAFECMRASTSLPKFLRKNMYKCISRVCERFAPWIKCQRQWKSVER